MSGGSERAGGHPFLFPFAHMGCAASAPPKVAPGAEPPVPAPVAMPSSGDGKTVSASAIRALRDEKSGGGAGAAAAAGGEAGAAAGGGGVGGALLGRLFGSRRGLAAAAPPPGPASPAFRFYAIRDAYASLDDVTEGLRAAGLESSNLVVALDFTKSNLWTGRASFGGRNLHWVDPDNLIPNPYMSAITAIGKVLSGYDDDNLIPVFGFGDSTTKDRSVFPFFPDRPARGFEEVLARYKELVPRIVLAGPTNFAPAIEAAIQIVQATRAYHILLIIADGQVTNRAHTEAAIVRASEFPLSIILVGVGDGPWDIMEDFDDSLPSRRFDNFQFVQLAKVTAAAPANPEVAFAIACLMEIPEQYMAIRKLGYI